MVNKERPVNLKLTSIHFPMPAITSILHRITGVVLFFFIPFLLWLTWYSLSSEQSFNNIKTFMSLFSFRFFLWVFISALFYHIVAGIRHLFMDIHIGETLKGGRYSAWFIFILSAVVIILLGIYLLIGFNFTL
ncbi:MAG: succinate dehydrogenase, cytochrome b556 subunit [Gammaproteobacteria bacterium RIFCSPHIGHO2_12_FULL_35_23]|nr:MAG: succinate dehydrogenase, cytochrome b556 subunit [Gammaproteobacteria bacterium RIFCSPHIGHO2_12_FULL_35_23]